MALPRIPGDSNTPTRDQIPGASNAFYDRIAEHYEIIFPVADQQVQFVAGRLVGRSRILDIGCATGAMAHALARREHRVVGIDLSESLVRRARARQGDSDNQPVFFEMDMTALDDDRLQGPFDGALCLGNTIVHLTEPSGIAAFVQSVHRRLREGGDFIGQIINYDRILAQKLAALPTIENDDVTFERRYLDVNYGGGRPFIFETTLTVKQTAQRLISTVELFPLTREQLAETLKAAGFDVVDWWGSFKGEPHGADSYATIFHARGR